MRRSRFIESCCTMRFEEIIAYCEKTLAVIDTFFASPHHAVAFLDLAQQCSE